MSGLHVGLGVAPPRDDLEKSSPFGLLDPPPVEHIPGTQEKAWPFQCPSLFASNGFCLGAARYKRLGVGIVTVIRAGGGQQPEHRARSPICFHMLHFQGSRGRGGL